MRQIYKPPLYAKIELKGCVQMVKMMDVHNVLYAYSILVLFFAFFYLSRTILRKKAPQLRGLFYYDSGGGGRLDITQYFFTQGPFAALFVWLLIYVMRANRERENRLQTLLDKFSDKYDVIITEIRDLKQKLVERK